MNHINRPADNIDILYYQGSNISADNKAMIKYMIESLDHQLKKSKAAQLLELYLGRPTKSRVLTWKDA